MNTNYVYPSAQVGELRSALLYASGPSSYAVAGDPVNNPGAGEYINFPSDCTSASGNYKVRFIPTTVGLNQIRAGGGGSNIVPNPSLSGWTAIWEYAGTANAPALGVPLTLGPLSAAATQSTYTANGLMTVVGANTLKAGQFILLTNGANAAGIFLNGTIVMVASATATSYTFNYAASKSLNYTIATDTLKYQVVYGGTTSNPVALGTAPGQSISVTGVAVASNVLTITGVNTGTTIVPGMFCFLTGLVAGEVPQGGIFQILTANTTTLTAAFIAPNLGTTNSETATLTVLVTNGNAPITASQDAFGINGSTVASTAASSSAATNISVVPVLQNLVPGNIVIFQGLTHGAALNGLITPVLAASLTGTNITAAGFTITSVTTGTGDLGSLGLLTTGLPVNGAQVGAGTNLSGESVQFAALVSSL